MLNTLSTTHFFLFMVSSYNCHYVNLKHKKIRLYQNKGKYIRLINMKKCGIFIHISHKLSTY